MKNKIETYRDNYGVLRVKSKLTNGYDKKLFKFHILLPSNHHIVYKLICGKHHLHFHAGVQTLTSILRETFWILKCRKKSLF